VAVEAGGMTREEAGRMIEGYKKRMAMAKRGGGGISPLFQELENTLISR